MDPLTAVGSISALVSLLDFALRTAVVLVEYTRNTEHAGADRQILAEETVSLSKLLSRLQARLKSPTTDQSWIDQRVDLLRQFARAYVDLAASLNFDVSTGSFKAESRFKSIKTIAKWSFTKNEVYSILERITRLQQYANTLMIDEQL